MNIVGLVTEYNPFHNGHAYHIARAKEVAKADYSIVIMSGNYMQRGTPAIMDKYTRTKMALSCGADLVLELPLPYATASAETFSYGALCILNQLGVVNSVCFGSECGDTQLLLEVARLLAWEPLIYQEKLKESLKQGNVFPVARSIALCHTLKDDPRIDASKLKPLLNEPNNILGIEYCKALLQLDSSITPIAITRIQSNYHQKELGKNISSATALRRALSKEEEITSLKEQMPPSAYAILMEYAKENAFIEENDFSLLLKYKLLYENSQSITRYFDLSKDLGKRIYNQLNHFHEFSSFVELLKTKELTHTRIQRALLHILLEIKKPCSPSYVRILGINKQSTKVVKSIQENSTIPIITSVAKANKILSIESQKEFQQELKANLLYESVACKKSKRPFVHEASRPMIIY